MSVRHRQLLITVLFFVLGLLTDVLAFQPSILGRLAPIPVFVILGIALARFRRFPERTGGYLLGISLVPAVLAAVIVIREPSCRAVRRAYVECYTPAAIPFLIGFVLVAVIGAVVLVISFRRW